MSVTRRVFSVLALLAALVSTTAAPASAEPNDLSYHYRYDLFVERVGSSEELAATVANRLTVYFPFDSDCRYLPHVGGRCELYSVPGLGLFGTTNPVLVVDRTPTSWTFRSLPGHVEGAGRYITFTFVRAPYGYELDVRAWGPWSLSASLTVSSGAAREVWQRFADNVSMFL
ncbi:hypothetical protein [Alloactinosynnema sp. L-07]|uniref:hypothetical protein n=1 Tax=Alloactinosynnema sp. L-07 TaxID=1653480 RepID=UPI00065F0217|nr:hypothetical protein [Alloactinosynnema sp. L-07]CRK55413.1 hypothetical protein [Alloactinosynnema sp. L-07]